MTLLKTMATIFTKIFIIKKAGKYAHRISSCLLAKKLYIALGFFYLLLARYDLFSLPCPLRYFTGYLCPGCGITTMIIALSYGDFAAAYSANPVLFILLPFIFYLAYLDRHDKKTADCQYFTMAIVAILLLWGIIRNI